jgi:SsrA-binding protein
MTTYADNKKALFDFEILERFEAGLVLEGHEVKAIRGGKATLRGAYVVVRGGEAYLVGASISAYQEKNTRDDYEADRPRKLLLSAKELGKLEKIDGTKGLTIVPIRLYNIKSYIKLEIGVARGKKQFDKRETIKARDTKRDLERELKWR